MTISELIAELELRKSKVGDVEVLVRATCCNNSHDIIRVVMEEEFKYSNKEDHGKVVIEI